MTIKPKQGICPECPESRGEQALIKDLCGIHYWQGVRVKAQAKKVLKPKKIYTINKMSDKGKSDIKKYIKLRKPYLVEHAACEIRVLCAGAKSVEIHHSAGRGPNLNRVETWFATCRACHDFCHEHVEQAKALGFIKSRLEINT
jgi:hypothetical protein